jgi:hypothetical protein
MIMKRALCMTTRPIAKAGRMSSTAATARTGPKVGNGHPKATVTKALEVAGGAVGLGALVTSMAAYLSVSAVVNAATRPFNQK